MLMATSFVGLLALGVVLRAADQLVVERVGGQGVSDLYV